ncbi:hypothetical protein ACN38_g12210 [Penicillium nordicum]|uniref:Uncharacterized protein n=1 Tax=Penicillium nordicum TaxID=229535 RepID=A0A0M8NTK4_9EURO|nr:hypothetical protein ACN38_g12210 [Penicillium nordicum]
MSHIIRISYSDIFYDHARIRVELYTNNGPHLLVLSPFSCGTITRLKYGIPSAEIDPSRSRDTATKWGR